MDIYMNCVDGDGLELTFYLTQCSSLRLPFHLPKEPFAITGMLVSKTCRYDSFQRPPHEGKGKRMREILGLPDKEDRLFINDQALV